MAGSEMSRGGVEYIVERYHVAFLIELRRLEELGGSCRELHLLGGDCHDLCQAFERLRDCLLRHMDEQELLFADGVVAAIEHIAVRAAASRLCVALETAVACEDCRPRALIHGLAHFAAEVEDHLDLEERIMHRNADVTHRLFLPAHATDIVDQWLHR